MTEYVLYGVRRCRDAGATYTCQIWMEPMSASGIIKPN